MAATVKVGTWSARATDAATGEAALRRLRGRRPGGADRTAVLSLVVQVESDDELDATLDTVRGLDGHSPCRTVVVALSTDGAPGNGDRPDQPSHDGDDDVAVGLRAVEHASGTVSYVEDVVVRLRHGSIDRLEAAVAPWLLPGLPVVAWMPGPLPRGTTALAAVADRLVVDTERLAGDGPPGTGALDEVLALARHHPVTDLAWVRLEPWRQLFAQLFVGADFAPFVRGVEQLEAAGRDPVPPLLLAGWIASRLHLDPAAVQVDAGSRSVLRAAARDGSRTARFRVERVTDGDVVLAAATVDGGPGRGRPAPRTPPAGPRPRRRPHGRSPARRGLADVARRRPCAALPLTADH